jgi:hypothetical protein
MKKTIVNNRQRAIRSLLVILLPFVSTLCFAQNPTDSLPGDPAAISVYTIQNLSFSSFSHGNVGGSVIISSGGARSVTGDIVALNIGSPYYQAIFDLDAPQGSIISILNGPDAILTGSNGGSMSLRIGNSYPASPFSTTVKQPQRTEVSVGGTLNVGNLSSSPPGSYTGNIYITFNLE